MSKSQEETDAIKEAEALGKKPAELSRKEMEQAAGGSTADISKYLRTLTSDKSRILVEGGDGKNLTLNNSLDFDASGNFYVLKREKNCAEEASDLQ